ncbi:hypothetical protein HYT00_03040 [Candidatus Giovannonibacteria bacterium]|nr:hypothetical protein [Candidatus Giovannonibacteria bacterium]
MSKVLFVMRATTHFHYYRSIVEALLRRGHRVEAIFERYGEQWSPENYLEPVEELKKETDLFEYSKALNRADSKKWIIRYARMILNYNHNLNFENMPRYFRDRAVSTFPIALKILFKTWLARFLIERKIVGKLMRLIERSFPADKKIIEHIKSFRPDVVIASAGNLTSNSGDIEYTKAAKELNIKTVVPVISWDFLTTKGAIHIIPDRLLVWNKFHEEEALRYHRFPRKKMRIIGAPFFDKWFSLNGKEPELDRKSFCSKYGLRPEDKIILYLGSTGNIASGDSESRVVRDLREALDNSSFQELQKTQIAVRAHPAHWKIFETIKNIDNIKLIPEIGGVMPDNKNSLQLFYDSLYHSDVVVGLNTSGMIDSIVAGKPLIAMLVERHKSRQEKTAYFQQLLNSGAAGIARNTDEFLIEVKKIFDGFDERKPLRDAFIKEAIRPRGINISAGEAAAMEVENILEKI